MEKTDCMAPDERFKRFGMRAAARIGAGPVASAAPAELFAGALSVSMIVQTALSIF